MSGMATIAAISFCSVATTSLGVPLGTNTPCMVSDSWPVMPASAMVGTSGSALERFLVVTASALSLPVWISCGVVVMATNDIGVSSASTACVAGAPPLYDVMTKSSL